MDRAHNFCAGPATLPLPVLQKVQNELTNYRGKGTSILEMSHRSREYTEIDRQATERLKKLLGAGDEWSVLFLQGGASSQFMMVPQNFLSSDRTADYIDTGTWSDNAIHEAKLFGNVHVPFSSKSENYTRIPSNSELELSDNASYLHFTSNNTIYGTQFPTEPHVSVPLVCDASSDFLSRPINLDRYGLIYAGAQKNLGPAGVTVVLIKDSFADRQVNIDIPTILDYKTHMKKIFNTPPVFAVYMVNYVLEWLEQNGGIEHFQSLNQKKSEKLYTEIDRDDFYNGTVQKESRSKMNVTFRLNDNHLEEKFLTEAKASGLLALKGHRSVGGIRASIYNACPMESVNALVDFMKDFRQSNG
ncbi:3-phosphoserine/phosphohydroxythreonine transaminase [Rhodohalobacter sp. 8-1]|uniref:3-phosphoserine/phosphohydroxythreonine transaminase n=1 Tax=Rhodohalobacter sp. 8-1 TaxID=3131972 RepID=UPI0030EDE4A5